MGITHTIVTTHSVGGLKGSLVWIMFASISCQTPSSSYQWLTVVTGTKGKAHGMTPALGVMLVEEEIFVLETRNIKAMGKGENTTMG
jgi:hypothetical protein